MFIFQNTILTSSHDQKTETNADQILCHTGIDPSRLFYIRILYIRRNQAGWSLYRILPVQILWWCFHLAHFITGLFLFVFLVVLLRNHSGNRYTGPALLRIGAALLMISLFSLTFFISYSLGGNAKIRTELPEKAFNEDKTLLNVLQPFLYSYTSYSSEKLFNPENVLFPKPYPVIAQRDTVYYDPGNRDYYSTQTTYYS